MQEVNLKNELANLKSRLLSEIESIDRPKTKAYVKSNKSGSENSNSSPLKSDELRYVNLNWSNWDHPTNFTSHRKIIGPIICFFKRKIQNFIFETILKDYIERQKSYQLELVRLCNKMCHYIDHRDSEIFWNTINKLDSDFSNFERRYDSLLNVVINKEKINN